MSILRRRIESQHGRAGSSYGWLCGVLSWGCLQAGSSACADPVYLHERDASGDCAACLSDASAQTPDASKPTDASDTQRTDATVPDALEPLLGSYAMRIRFFVEDSALGSLAKFSHEKLGLARVVRDATSGGVQLELKVCADTFKLQIAGLSDLLGATSYPERLPTAVFTIAGDPQNFHSEAAPRLGGYHADAPKDCAPSKRVPASADQVWLADGQCDCPSSQDAPTAVSDCRIDDPDRDQNPGLTVQLAGSGSGNEFARYRDSSQLSQGAVAGDRRHTGLWLANNDFYQLQCTSGPCPRSGFRMCKADVNPVSFAPIDDLGSDSVSWDCAAVLPRIESGELFLSDPLTFPTDC